MDATGFVYRIKGDRSRGIGYGVEELGCRVSSHMVEGLGFHHMVEGLGFHHTWFRV